VGPKYQPYDVDEIMAQVIAAVPSDARCDITYDGYRARMNVLFHSNVEAERVVAGEFFKAGLNVKTADDGTGSIWISSEIWRNLCLNLYIIDHSRELVTRKIHVGDPVAIAQAVTLGIQEAMNKVGHFVSKWSEAKSDLIESMEGVRGLSAVENVQDVFRGLVANKVVHVSGVKPVETFGRLLGAFEKEPGNDRTAIVNAVTRMAHEEVWPRWTDGEDLERLGGMLLFQKHWDTKLRDDEREKLSF